MICDYCRIPIITGRKRKYHKKCQKKASLERSITWYYTKKNEENDFLEKRAKSSRTTRRSNPEKRMLLGAKQRASDKNLPFNITVEDIKIPKECPILKTKFIHGTPYAASLDRITPSLGYVKGNVMVISRKANAMKQDATQQELEKFAEWVLRNK